MRVEAPESGKEDHIAELKAVQPEVAGERSCRHINLFVNNKKVNNYCNLPGFEMMQVKLTAPFDKKFTVSRNFNERHGLLSVE